MFYEFGACMSFNRIDPPRAALLVMDYQAGIIAQIQNGDALLGLAERAVGTARRRGAHVGYVRVAFTDAEFRAVPQSNKGFSSLKSSGRTFGADDPVTAIDRRIAPQDGDISVRKIRVGAFSTTDLHEQLQQRGVDTLILAGISTSGVVLSTIRDAADRDYRLFVLCDACADPQPDVHALLMEKVFPRQADVITVNDLDKLF
jgi:nicotinamidase-related amidase